MRMGLSLLATSMILEWDFGTQFEGGSLTRRSHLTTVRVSSAVRDVLSDEGYSLRSLRADAIAGLTTAVVAIPLAMALAIAVGVPPQYGLYSAIVGGVVAALAGGSRYSVSGPTAAFVVVLAPVVSRYGLAGLATAGLMGGVFLAAMGATKMGRLVEYVPEPVTLGFTSGIAVVIAVLQLNDFLGLGVANMPEPFVAKVGVLGSALGSSAWPAILVGVTTLTVRITWPQNRLRIPGYAPAVLVGSVLAIALSHTGHPVETIGSRFTYDLAGELMHGVPRALPKLALPWHLPGPEGRVFSADLDAIRALIPAATSIAALGAIESLLCALVLDRRTRTQHHSNGELVGLGLANIATPLVGGIPVTAAIARSAVNVESGARTPFAAAFHSVFVLLSVLLLAPLLSFVPMASMAAVLLVVAWNMAELPSVKTLVRESSNADRLVFVVCFTLTVVFDMVVAVAVGLVLAAFLFMRDIARFTQVRDVTRTERYVPQPLSPGWRVVKITGAMFFAAADRVLSELLEDAEDSSGLVVYCDGVTMLDAGGIGAVRRFDKECARRDIRVLLTDLQARPERRLKAAGMPDKDGSVDVVPTLAAALQMARVDRR